MLKEYYKQRIYNLLFESEHMDEEEFRRLAASLSSKKDLDKTSNVSRGDQLTPRDTINYHANLIHRALAAGKSPSQRSIDALRYHDIDVEELMKRFKK